MGRPVEKVIVRPGHAFFGVPTLSLLACGAFGFLVMSGYLLLGLGLFLIIHVASMVIRAKYQHFEMLLWRAIQKKRGAHDWSGRRRCYSG